MVSFSRADLAETDHLVHFTMDSPIGNVYSLITSDPAYNAQLYSGGATNVMNEREVGTGSLLLNAGIFRLPSIAMGDNGITVSFWFKTTGYNTVCSFKKSGSSTSIWAYNAYYGLELSGMLSVSPRYNTDVWTMVTIVNQPDQYGSISIYYNGVFERSYGSGGLLKGQTYDVNYLGSNNLVDESFTGYIDDFRIIKKALTSDEVDSLYTESKLISSFPTMAPTTFRNYDPRLQAYLPFDQGDYYAQTPTSMGYYQDKVAKRKCGSYESLVDSNHKIDGSGSLFNQDNSESKSCIFDFDTRYQNNALNQHSFSLWYKTYKVTPSTVSQVDYNGILSIFSRSSFGIVFTGHKFIYRNINSANDPNGIHLAYEFPVDNNWHFVVFVNDAFDWHCYLDGQWVGHLDVSAISETETPNIRIGKIKGWVDDFRIYNTLLNQSSVQELYRSYCIPADDDDIMLYPNEPVDSTPKDNTDSASDNTDSPFMIRFLIVFSVWVIMVGGIVYFYFPRVRKISSNSSRMPIHQDNKSSPPFPLREDTGRLSSAFKDDTRTSLSRCFELTNHRNTSIGNDFFSM
jgi:hypothetical protein